MKENAEEQKVKQEAEEQPKPKTSVGRMDVERTKQNLTLLRQKFFTYDH